MAQSKAKKIRRKLIREGKRNPELGRSPFSFADLRTRKTKTKQDCITKQKHKNHGSFYGDDGSFYFGSNYSVFRQRLIANLRYNEISKPSKEGFLYAIWS
ncbi:hypothetical protein LBW89_15600 [Paenibacillus sp. alder61]|nr:MULTISPECIES: hypothetical protein [Paenibacillus]MCA1294449.1 hypothetical protein [Paenibacillus sp. alder61]